MDNIWTNQIVSECKHCTHIRQVIDYSTDNSLLIIKYNTILCTYLRMKIYNHWFNGENIYISVEHQGKCLVRSCHI